MKNHDNYRQLAGIIELMKALTDTSMEDICIALWAASPFGVLITEVAPAGEKFVYVNDTACEMFGYSRDEFFGLGVIDIHPKGQESMVMRELKQHYIAQGLHVTFNIDCIRKDGLRFVADVYSKIIAPNGEHYIVGFFIDRDKVRLMLTQQKGQDVY